MTKQSHHNLKRLDEEGLLVRTPQINESTVSSRRPSGAHQCSTDEGMEVKLEKPHQMLHACGNI